MRPALAVLLLLSACALTACGGGGAATDASAVVIDPAAFSRGLSHAYFPTAVGATRIYEGQDEGLSLYEEVRTLPAQRVLLGVPCTALEERAYVAGVLRSVSTEWFAEDRNGNVWKFGEEALEWDGAAFVRSADSWVAAPGGRSPWLAFGAAPQVGDRYIEPDPAGANVHAVTAVGALASVPAGQFANCVQIAENPEDPADGDIILYAPGTGRVAETSASGWAQLVSIRQP